MGVPDGVVGGVVDGEVGGVLDGEVDGECDGVGEDEFDRVGDAWGEGDTVGERAGEVDGDDWVVDSLWVAGPVADGGDLDPADARPGGGAGVAAGRLEGIPAVG